MPYARQAVAPAEDKSVFSAAVVVAVVEGKYLCWRQKRRVRQSGHIGDGGGGEREANKADLTIALIPGRVLRGRQMAAARRTDPHCDGGRLAS